MDRIGVQDLLPEPFPHHRGMRIRAIVIEDTSVDQLVRRLGHAGGYLVGQQGTKYVFFGRNVDEVTIAIPLRHVTVSEAGEKLREFKKGKVIELPHANTVVVRGTSEELHRAKKFLLTIDYERPNVFLELLVVEYFHGDAFAWSYDVVNGAKGKVSYLRFAPGAGGVQGEYDAISDLSTSFQLNLTALVEDQDARVVTNPHVPVRSGEPGKLDFQEELNIILTNNVEVFGTARRLEKLTAGVLLNVTPNQPFWHMRFPWFAYIVLIRIRRGRSRLQAINCPRRLQSLLILKEPYVLEVVDRIVDRTFYWSAVLPLHIHFDLHAPGWPDLRETEEKGLAVIG